MLSDDIKHEKYLSKKQILFATEHQVSVSIVVSQEAGTSLAGGKKVVKAGTPLKGDLDARTTGFTKATTSGSDAVGILLHDVDVTTGDANGTLLIHGFVNQNMVDADVAEMYTPTVKSALNLIRIMKA